MDETKALATIKADPNKYLKYFSVLVNRTAREALTNVSNDEAYEKALHKLSSTEMPVELMLWYYSTNENPKFNSINEFRKNTKILAQTVIDFELETPGFRRGMDDGHMAAVAAFGPSPSGHHGGRGRKKMKTQKRKQMKRRSRRQKRS
jgi:hypothetical protein